MRKFKSRTKQNSNKRENIAHNQKMMTDKLIKEIFQLDLIMDLENSIQMPKMLPDKRSRDHLQSQRKMRISSLTTMKRERTTMSLTSTFQIITNNSLHNSRINLKHKSNNQIYLIYQDQQIQYNNSQIMQAEHQPWISSMNQTLNLLILVFLSKILNHNSNNSSKFRTYSVVSIILFKMQMLSDSKHNNHQLNNSNSNLNQKSLSQSLCQT